MVPLWGLSIRCRGIVESGMKKTLDNDMEVGSIQELVEMIPCP